MDGIDILVVGAGPAGLAAALRAKQGATAAGRELSVVVIDKAPAAGNHTLSGAAFEAACLDDLVPGWKDLRNPFVTGLVPVERDDMYFLRAKAANRIPPMVVPSRMHHVGDYIISISRLTAFLAEQAEAAGVEVYHGYTARTLIVEDGAVKGVRLAEVGLAHDGAPKGNHLAAGGDPRPDHDPRGRHPRRHLDGSSRERFGGGVNPQVYSLGMKAIVQFPEASPFGNNRVMHTLGYPMPPSVFGGGFMYAMGEKTVAVGLILGLDWKYGDLNPQREFETFRAHPFISRLLKGGTTVATGAKTIPEGGLYAQGALVGPRRDGHGRRRRLRQHGEDQGHPLRDPVRHGRGRHGPRGAGRRRHGGLARRVPRPAGGERDARRLPARPELPPGLQVRPVRGDAAVAGPVVRPQADRDPPGRRRRRRRARA